MDAFFVEAEHLSVERLGRAIDEVLEILSREFYDYRNSLAAPEPDPRAAFDSAISLVLAPLAHEQQTAACTAQLTAAAVDKAVAAALAKAPSAADGASKKAAAVAAAELADVKRQLNALKRARGDDPDAHDSLARHPRPAGALGGGATRNDLGRSGGGGSPAPPIEYWTGVAKLIQNKIKADAECQNCKWPCMKLFLTGACGDPSCRICTSPGGLAGKGETATRKLATDELSRLMASGRISDACKAVITKGKSART